MTARHATRGLVIFLQMQAFLQERSYVYPTAGRSVSPGATGPRAPIPRKTPELG